MVQAKKPKLVSMNRGNPILFPETKQVYCPVFKCGYTSSHKAYSGIGKTLASFNDLIDYDDYEKVTMVRNPYDRVVSLWTSQNNRDRLHEISTSFEHFVSNIKELLSNGFIDGHYNTLVQNLSIKGKFMADTVFKLEEGNLAKHLPPIDGAFPVCNRSSNRDSDYHAYYTSDKVIDEVTKLYREDLEKFEYEF